jgi:hypothetical protein
MSHVLPAVLLVPALPLAAASSLPRRCAAGRCWAAAQEVGEAIAFVQGRAGNRHAPAD